MRNEEHISWAPAAGVDTRYARAILDIPEDQALSGPHVSEDRVVIWEGFGKKFNELLDDLHHEMDIDTSDLKILRQAVTSPFRTWLNDAIIGQDAILESTGQDEMIILPLVDRRDQMEYGTAAIMKTVNDDYMMVGLLAGPDLVVSQNYRNLGIGRAIIAARLLSSGDLPTWDHDKPSYSPGGAATVKAGLTLARKMADEVLVDRPEEGMIDP